MTFRLGRIPVRIHPWFWLTALLLSGGDIQNPRVVLIWIGVVFVSVLVHELGHAFAGILFGLTPQIDLHGMGGTTSWTAGRPIGHVKSIVVSVAGPFAGLLIAIAITVAFAYGWAPRNEWVATAAGLARQINIVWGVINLIPLLPLDGGNVMRSFLHLLTKNRGERPARYVSILVATAGLAWAVKHHQLWLGFLAGLFAFRNIQALRALDAVAEEEAQAPAEPAQERGEGEEEREREPEPFVPMTYPEDPAEAMAEAYRALEREDGQAAIRAVKPALSEEAPPETREAGTRLLAYAFLLEGQWSDLLSLLDRARAAFGRDDLERYARTARELGRESDATAIEAMLSS